MKRDQGISECSDSYGYIASKTEGGMDKITVRVEPKYDVDSGQWDDFARKLHKTTTIIYGKYGC